jgi:iron complex transport system substrate-binding protein
MCIVSLLPSATEILFALGLDKEIVGVSHECDFPAQARSKPVVISSRIPHNTAPLEIDRMVRQFVAKGESLYAVHVAALQELKPDLIVTQDLCHVCAASPDDLAGALRHFAVPPQVLCLNPQNLGDVWRDILWVGEETRRGPAAIRLVEEIGTRLAANERMTATPSEQPRVGFMEWLQPYYVGGHWVPEMIERAGGIDAFGKIGTPSFRVTPEEIIAAAPDVLLIAPCGYSAERARDEYQSFEYAEGWSTIPAVRNDRVYALAANSYFSRPGPRLVIGIEILTKVLHPELAVSPEAESAVLKLSGEVRAAHIASA